jgi:hypothetical protein
VNDLDQALALALAADEISNAICGLGARIDQLEAARRDLLYPVSNIPPLEGLSDHD